MIARRGLPLGPPRQGLLRLLEQSLVRRFKAEPFLAASCLSSALTATVIGFVGLHDGPVIKFVFRHHALLLVPI
jgi:hypothetical protein